MRKVLLTTAAVVGAAISFGGVASAQQVSFPPPPAGEAGPSFGASSSPPPLATTVVTPGETAPNSFVVHLNARINWYAGVEGSSVNESDGYKLDPVSFLGYMRVYPGFNATAANGLKYGVVGEIRMPGSNLATGGSTPGATSTGQTLYWHTAYGYVGSDDLGDFRFGMGPNVTALWQGNFTTEGFNDGAWDGDVPSFVPGNAGPSFPFADDDPLWTGNKIVYLSPNFSGFQFGASYQPNTANLWDTAGVGCGSASAGCNALAAGPTTLGAGSGGRSKDMVDVGGMYNGTFNGFGVGALATYVGSGHVANNSDLIAAQQYYGYSVGVFGLSLSYAGVTVAGNVNFGQMNGDWGLQPRGGVDEVAWIAGVQYATGPVVVGASYFKNNYSGNWLPDTGVARTENDLGFAAGGTYNLVPGMAIYLSYLYGQRHQLGWDFNSGTPGIDQNNTHASVISIGSVLSW